MKYKKINKDKVGEMTEAMYAMTWLFQKETNLPMVIFVSPKRGAKHEARVKVSKTHSHKVNIHDTVSVSIEDEPQIKVGKGLKTKDFKIVKEFIMVNKDTLLDYWNYKLTTKEMIGKLKS